MMDPFIRHKIVFILGLMKGSTTAMTQCCTPHYHIFLEVRNKAFWIHWSCWDGGIPKLIHCHWPLAKELSLCRISFSMVNLVLFHWKLKTEVHAGTLSLCSFESMVRFSSITTSYPFLLNFTTAMGSVWLPSVMIGISNQLLGPSTFIVGWSLLSV